MPDEIHVQLTASGVDVNGRRRKLTDQRMLKVKPEEKIILDSMPILVLTERASHPTRIGAGLNRGTL